MAKATSRHKAMGKHKKYAASRNKAVDQSGKCDVIDDTAARKTTSPFLQLPNEIKDMIYRYCLVVEGPISPYPAYFEEADLGPWRNGIPSIGTQGSKVSSLALLRVCKSIGTRAKNILFSENTWHLTHDSQDLSLKPPWKQILEQPHHPRIGHLVVAFDCQDFEFDFDGDWDHWRTVAQEARDQRFKPILSKIYSWKIDIIRALLDRNLIAKGLTMDFEFAFEHGTDPVNDRWTDLIAENDRWFKDYIVTRSGRQIRTPASSKAKNIFPGPSVKFEPTYRRLFDRDEIKIFEAHGFRGQFT
ncbi:MAG: hypothetical protein Q9203_003352 [Teloschistes exilis]